ncbi:GmrSD restriction endonuclease domain-containing protein [Flavobacterium bizetiae]|uniref:GmrSD restriction endonuclease domain-containing protein n=1 Tax=Flavobacterium bizetiae TaxID=2704140 RepID=UPI0037565AB3
MSNNTLENGIGFWQLISKNKIEIPIIQRDYAQGRNDDKTKIIRNGFLSSLIDTLENKKNLELDFVYGNVNEKILQPLDGQQRLTTLFLLHWYIYFKTDKSAESKNALLKFTYETRTSSREFCTELVENHDNLGEGKKISEKISDSNWFFLSWKKDPTIKAMLIMLDAIEEKLEVKSEDEMAVFFKDLTSENPPITFLFKELKDIGLTDDLYIKMNARGVPLTDFENFKARFEKHIDDNKWELEESNLLEKTSHKIDTSWTDLFWKHRGSDNLIDDEFIKFIAGIAIINYAKNKEFLENEKEFSEVKKILLEKNKNTTDEAVKTEIIERNIQRLFNNPNTVSPKDFPTKNAFEYLKNCLDIYSKNKNDETFPSDLELWDYCKKGTVDISSDTKTENNLFIEFVKNGETTYKQRILFFAQTVYLLNADTINQEFLSHWMRVIRNIAHNSTIDSASGFVGAVNLVNELSKGSLNIYEYLVQNKIESTFAKTETTEEILKSSIITNPINNKISIFLIEDTNFFKGKIKFALHCIDFENNQSAFDENKLNSLYTVINEHLNSDDISAKFRSAMFTVKNNDFYEYWRSWSYGTDTHKRCLIENTSDLKWNFTNGYYGDYLKELLLKLIDKSLDQIINEYSFPEQMPNWKRRLIKEPTLQEEYAQSRYFGISNDNKAFLFYNRKRPNTRKDCKKIE